MKRFFVFSSNLLFSLFLVWIFFIWSATFVTYTYPSVVVFDAPSSLQFQTVAESLTDLAKENDSLIAIQHQELGEDGSSKISYTSFGSGQIPTDMKTKTITDTSAIGIESNYFILSGNLTTHQLRKKLSQLGITRMTELQPSAVQILVTIFSRGFQSIGLIIFLLTFASLSLIYHVRLLHSTGVRLISGDSIYKIFFAPLWIDFFNCFLGSLGGIILTTICQQLLSLPKAVFSMATTGLLLYNLSLLAISLFFSLLFSIGIYRTHLNQIIKGKIPTSGVISLILIGQFLAIITVAYSFNHVTIYHQGLTEQRQGLETWKAQKELTNLSVSREGLELVNSNEIIEKQKVWFRFLNQSISSNQAFLARHYLAEKALSIPNNSKNLIEVWEPSNWQKNLLIVTPGYLQKQNIKVDSDVQNQIAHLKQGEFILLLPKTLKQQEKSIVNTTEKELTNLFSSENYKQMMTATTFYLEDRENYFAYNTTSISYQQNLYNPIIVVITPNSTGEAYNFWEEVLQDYVWFKNIKKTQQLINEHKLETWVNDLETGYHKFQTQSQNLSREIWATVASAVLTIFTSVLMFNTMNLLYFEEWRREIFIKRIDGYHFIELHRTYFLSQWLVFLATLPINLFLTHHFFICLFVLLLFIANSFFLLHRQMKKEDHLAASVLKGA